MTHTADNTPGLAWKAIDAQDRTRIGNTPSCPLCGEQHGESECTEKPMPWCEHCQSYHHTTAEHITRTVTIDITPVGCQTPEGIKRVRDAQYEWDSSAHAVANAVDEFLKNYSDTLTVALRHAGISEGVHQLTALVGARNRKQEAFLRAVAGR